MATTVQGLAPGRADGATAEPLRRPGASLTDVLLLLMALIWGVNYSVLKLGTDALQTVAPEHAPVAFNGARVLLATAVLAAIAATRRDRTPARGDIVRLVLLGVLGHGLYQYLFIEGITRTSAGTAALILAASPAFIGIVGRVLGTERPTPRAWGGIGLQLLGMGGVVLGSAAQASAPGATVGVGGTLIILGAALAWAVYAVLLKPFAERVDAMHLSAWTLVGGALTLGAAAVPALARLDAARVPATAWLAIGYSGLLAMVIAYLFYYRGVRTVGPVRTAMFSNLQPIVALVVAFLTLGERPGVPQLAGTALITAGLLVSRR